MEEEEARRLQRKLREEVDEEDYGFTALEDATQDEVSDPLEEKQPSSSSTSGKSKATLVRELERTSPESLALAWDFQAAAEDLVRVEQALVRYVLRPTLQTRSLTLLCEKQISQRPRTRTHAPSSS